jgi:hypothetical protein
MYDDANEALLAMEIVKEERWRRRRRRRRTTHIKSHKWKVFHPPKS